LAGVLTKDPDLIEQLALCLDREMRLISNWKHLSRELKVDVNVIKSLEQYSDFSPTIRLFEYLEVTQPDLTIQQLKQALIDIRRNDLVSLLTIKGKIIKVIGTLPILENGIGGLMIKTLFSTYGEFGEREEGDGMLSRGKFKRLCLAWVRLFVNLPSVIS